MFDFIEFYYLWLGILITCFGGVLFVMAVIQWLIEAKNYLRRA